MSHPPIPPKSHFFEMVSLTDTECEDCLELLGETEYFGPVPNAAYFNADSQWLGHRNYDAICVEHNDTNARLIIAAVAEVEWRKRTERWQRVWQYEYESFTMFRHGMEQTAFIRHQKMHDLAWAEMKRSSEVALAWRAWGEAK